MLLGWEQLTLASLCCRGRVCQHGGGAAMACGVVSDGYGQRKGIHLD
jgi:hypothetical protein